MAKSVRLSPGQLKYHVWVKQVIAGEERGWEALWLAFLQEPLQQLLGKLRIT